MIRAVTRFALTHQLVVPNSPCLAPSEIANCCPIDTEPLQGSFSLVEGLLPGLFKLQVTLHLQGSAGIHNHASIRQKSNVILLRNNQAICTGAGNTRFEQSTLKNILGSFDALRFGSDDEICSSRGLQR